MDKQRVVDERVVHEGREFVFDVMMKYFVIDTDSEEE